jgi:hypothetical protein
MFRASGRGLIVNAGDLLHVLLGNSHAAIEERFWKPKVRSLILSAGATKSNTWLTSWAVPAFPQKIQVRPGGSTGTVSEL